MRVPAARSGFRWRLVAALAVVFTFGLVVAAQANAIMYTSTISPTSAAAGSTATYEVTIRNLIILPLGSANVQIPTGWSDVTPGTPRVYKSNGQLSPRTWTANVVGNVLQLRAVGPGEGNRLPPFWSVRVSFQAKASCTTGQSQWTTTAKNGSGFTGFTFVLLGGQPKVNVSGTCADHLRFGVQPSETSVDQAIAPAVTVRVEDAGNNLVTSYSGSVTVALGTPLPAPGTGAFTGDSTLTATVVNGVATFSNLKIDTAAFGYTLDASSGSLTSVEPSDPFDVIVTQQSLAPGATSGSNCTGTDPTSADVNACVSITLPGGAANSISLVTTGPVPGAPEGSTTFTGVLGDLKDEFGDPVTTQESPGMIALEIDESVLPGCSPVITRSPLGVSAGDYYPWRDFDLLFKEPRTCVTLSIQFTEGGDWNPVPVCGEDHDEAFDDDPDGDETFWADKGATSLFDFNGETYDNGACMAASNFDTDGDLILYVMFFGDPRLATK